MARSNATKNSLLKFGQRKSSLTINSSPGAKSNAAATGQSNDGVRTKKYLRHTGFNQMINEMIISACQKYMEFNMRKRLIYYCLLVIVGGVLCDMTPTLVRAFVPFKTEKTSILNTYFVKIGWFWTLLLLVPFQCLTRKSIGNSDKWYDLKDLSRTLIVTLVWYFSVNTFNMIEVSTGKCTKFSIKSRRDCLRSGWNWLGFDISGHTFLLLFANLILFEESKIINGFENFGYLLDNQDKTKKATTKSGCAHYATYNRLLVPIRVLYISMTFLALLWDLMLFQTVLHYHSLLQKVVALLWALAAWCFCYSVLFPLNVVPSLMTMPLRIPTRLEPTAQS